MATQSINGLTVPSFIPRYRVCVVPESRHAGPLVLIRDSAGAAEDITSTGAARPQTSRLTPACAHHSRTLLART